MKQEDGFKFYEFPSLSGEGRALIVILHGRNSHPDKFLPWAAETQKDNPDADVLIVQAPVAMHAPAADRAKPDDWPGIVDDLYSWIDIGGGKRKQAKMVLSHAFNEMAVVGKLNKFIDGQLKKRGLDDENLGIIGFSMGGIMAIQTALHRKKECAAVVCHSGAVLPLTKARKKPPALILMGDQDDMFYAGSAGLPPETAPLLKKLKKMGINSSLHHDDCVDRLRKTGVKVEEKVFKNLAHAITPESWHAASAFVAKHLKLKK